MSFIYNINCSVSSNNLFYIFILCICVNLFFLLLVFVNGLSLTGFVISYFYIAFFGFYVGIFSGYVYLTFGFNLIKYCLFSFYPSALVFAISLLLACRESIAFSGVISKLFMPDKMYNLYHDFKLYCMRFLFILSLSVVSAIYYAVSLYFIK